MNLASFRLIAAVLLACIAFSLPRAETVTINPSDDAALYTCNGCNLISNGQYVVVGGYIQGAVKFPSIPGPITQAILSLNPYGLPLFAPNIDVYGFTSNSGLIDAASANAGTFLGTWTLPPGLGFGQDAYFDVTGFVANTTAPYIGFNLRSSSGVDIFSSIEFNYGHPSQLLVTTSDDFCNSAGYDNATPQTTGLFTDLRRGTEINADYANCVLNLTGSAGSAGDMWITLLGEPSDVPPTFSCVEIQAEVNIHRFDNRKAVGLVTNFDSGIGTGLFFGLYDNGGSDALTLSTFDATTGKLTSTVANIFLGSKIKENVWYSLDLAICNSGTSLEAEGHVVGQTVDETLQFVGLRPAGISSSGQIGIAGQAKNASVDSSVRGFVWDQLD